MKVYSKGEVADIRVYNLAAEAGKTEDVTFTKPINTEDYLKYNIEAYVYDLDTNKIVSNIYR